LGGNIDRPGARIGRAAALLEASGPQTALTALAQTPAEDYQPYWVVRGEALARLGRTVEAREAFARALGLTEDPAVRAYLQGRVQDAG
jgi:predicted RNA polymerase sigma factor